MKEAFQVLMLVVRIMLYITSVLGALSVVLGLWALFDYPAGPPGSTNPALSITFFVCALAFFITFYGQLRKNRRKDDERTRLK